MARRLELGLAARAAVVRQFDWRDRAEDYRRFFREAVQIAKQPSCLAARPAFAELFLAAARTVSGLFSFYDEPLVADFAGLKAAAQEVRLLEHCYEPFEQRKWSNRSQQRFPLRGLSGGGVYGDVPLAFLPWMLWGGRLHVGPHRVAGAGGWRLVLD